MRLEPMTIVSKLRLLSLSLRDFTNNSYSAVVMFCTDGEFSSMCSILEKKNLSTVKCASLLLLTAH